MATDAELLLIAAAQLSSTQAGNLLAAHFPGSAPATVLETHLEPIITALKNSRSSLGDATLVTAINTADDNYWNAIKAALQASQTTAENYLGNLVTTDDIA